jgi:hypothetical protein
VAPEAFRADLIGSLRLLAFIFEIADQAAATHPEQ